MAFSVIATILGVYGRFKEMNDEKIKVLETFGAPTQQILHKVVSPVSVQTLG